MKKLIGRLPLCGILFAAVGCVASPEVLEAEDLYEPGLEAADLGDDLGVEAAGVAAPCGYAFSIVDEAGQTVPGGAESYWGLYATDLDDKGDAIYSTWLTRDGSFFGAAYFRTNDGDVELLAHTGGSGPGGVTFGSQFGFYSGGLNKAGEATFSFYVDGIAPGRPEGGVRGVFRSDRNGVQSTVMVPDSTIAPNGSPFRGAHMRANLNKRGDIAFTGMIDTDEGIHQPGQPYHGLGLGVFVAAKAGGIESVVSPGDPAPGGGTFDFAQNGFINDRGDVAFGAHVEGEECRDFGMSQAVRIFCAESVYLRKNGHIVSIAHQDEAAPGGGVYRLAFGPVLNKRGDVLFAGDITPAPQIFKNIGLFLHRGGQTMAVVRPGDLLPGGGHMASGLGNVTTYDLNDRGEVVFAAVLDTDDDADGSPDTGIYAWKSGGLRLVARSGLQIAGLGTVSGVAASASVGIASNNRGQVAIPVSLVGGHRALVLATPQHP